MSYGDSELKPFHIIGIVLIVVMAIGGGMWGCPKYGVYSERLAGQAELERAEFNRRISIEEARAQLEAAQHLRAAEVERARGVAEANEIIGQSLQDNEAYLRYLWIQGLHDGNGETIYIATEANLPILEANRLPRQ